MPEYVDIVDENDRIIRRTTRKEMRTKGLRHRGTAILVFNSLGQLFVHKRTATKDVFPEFYDIAVGGVVETGETYETAAKRELAEEVGVTNVGLEFLFKVHYESPIHKCVTAIYSCEYDGPLTLQEEELEQGCFLDLDKAKELVAQKKVCPDSIQVFERFLQHMQSQRYSSKNEQSRGKDLQAD
ncbi:MAG: NUDIX hydrolase [Candidatus Heimdallarchaeota archaeon]